MQAMSNNSWAPGQQPSRPLDDADTESQMLSNPKNSHMRKSEPLDASYDKTPSSTDGFTKESKKKYSSTSNREKHEEAKRYTYSKQFGNPPANKIYKPLGSSS